jgi:hypothetical protein
MVQSQVFFGALGGWAHMKASNPRLNQNATFMSGAWAPNGKLF